MSGQTYVYVAWAAGAVAAFIWFAVRHAQEPERFGHLVEKYPPLPDTATFAWTTFAFASAIWPAVVVAALVESLRNEERR